MAQATVFVDDAVTGRLPSVCVKDGLSTNDRLTVSQMVGDGTRLGVAWLLVLAGPPGWLALLVIGSSRASRGDQLTVEVPMSAAAYERVQAARRQVRVTVGATVAGLLAILAVSYFEGSANVFPAFVLLGLAGAVVVMWAQARVRRASIDLSLDASRRWVTISDVHPAFAEAVRASQSAQ